MPSIQKLLVLATLGLGVVADSCSKDVTIDTLNPTFDCDDDTVTGKVTVSESLQGNLKIDGPKKFKGDFIVKNCTGLLSISSNSLKSIGGEFLIEDATLLSNVNLQSLSTINKLTLNRLGQLSTLTFSSEGVSEASSVNIADTFLSDISGLNLATVDTMTINSNRRLKMFNSNLVNITKSLILTQNGNDMQVNLTELETAYEISLSNIKSLSTPALTEVKSAIRFDTNPNLESFEAANLTNVGTSKSGGSLSFINNVKLTNVSFPVLKKISGDLTIRNNTKLDEISGFPALTSVENMLLGGGFENVTLPKLDDVKGTINVKSTSNITDVCKFFDGIKSKVQGKVNCESNASSESANSKDGLNKTSKGDKDSGANGVPVYGTAAMFLALVAGAAQLL